MKLNNYETELREAGKARNTITSYVQPVERFLNWLAGSYRPTRGTPAHPLAQRVPPRQPRTTSAGPATTDFGTTWSSRPNQLSGSISNKSNELSEGHSRPPLGAIGPGGRMRKRERTSTLDPGSKPADVLPMSISTDPPSTSSNRPRDCC